MLNKIPHSHFYALAAIFLWSFAYAGSRFVVTGGHISAYELSFIRNFTAMLCFAALLVARRQPVFPALRDIPIFLVGGLLGFAMYIALFNKGLETINGGTSATLVATVPLLSTAVASALFKEKLPRLALASMLISFSGVAVLSLWGGGLSVNIGIVWTLAAAVVVSLYNVIQRYIANVRKTRRYSPLQITAYNFFGAVLLSLYLLPSTAQQFMAAPAAHQWAGVLMGIFPSAAAFLLWTKAFSCAKSTSSVVNYLFVMPVFAIAACYFMLGETPGMETIAGGAIILSGLWLFNRAMHSRA